MKKLILFCTILFSANLSTYAQTSTEKEIVILRVNHFLKSNGLESRLNIEIGNSPNHSLKGRIENGEGGTVRYTKADGTVTVFTNEPDMLSFLLNSGYEIVNIYENTVGARPFVNYLLEKSNSKGIKPE